jgi:HrpA-like RNA helicase
MLVQSIGAHLNERMEAIPWYRDVDVKDLQRALAEPGQTRTKVFIATDIAEVSITLAHLTFVVDMAMTRKPRIDASAVGNVAFPPLDTFWAPEFSQRQRRGRVGRVKPGFYISILRAEDTSKVSKMTPPIENQRVDELTLHLLQSTDDPTRLLSRASPPRPPRPCGSAAACCRTLA